MVKLKTDRYLIVNMSDVVTGRAVTCVVSCSKTEFVICCADVEIVWACDMLMSIEIRKRKYGKYETEHDPEPIPFEAGFPAEVECELSGVGTTAKPVFYLFERDNVLVVANTICAEIFSVMTRNGIVIVKTFGKQGRNSEEVAKSISGN